MIVKRLVHLFSLDYTKVVIYMLQSTEYDPIPYVKWFWRVEDFTKVMYRRNLKMTKAARLLLTAIRAGVFAQYITGLVFAALAISSHSLSDALVAFALIVSAPVVWAQLITLPLIAGRRLIVTPAQKKKIKSSEKIFALHPAIKIAVVGSYGKTTMKEMLLTVLSEAKKVAATEANKNVAISHAEFARKLSGNEEILIIEFGEGAPGDVPKFSKLTKPDMGIITGLAPAHLDKYKTLQKAGEDIFGLADYLNGKKIYVNSESDAVKPFLKKGFILYSADEAAGWRISNPNTSIDGLSFKMSKGAKKMDIKATVLGKHQIGPIASVCAIAAELGMTTSQIEAGAAKIKPFEHRMQPYQVGGAWIINDAYNGNIDGMKAGLELLSQLKAKRKIYITPGLVDQGPETTRVHHKLGELIAEANVNEVILMKNSVTDHILSGLEKGNFKGKIVIEKDPLLFYSNIDQFVAAGDLVLMQNDWTDNYN